MNRVKRAGLLRWMVSWRGLLLLVVWGGSLTAAALAGAYAHRDRAKIRAFLFSVQQSPILRTNLYNVAVRKLSVPGEGRDGGIAPLGDGVLFANRLGEMWYVTPELELRPLDLRVPINVEEFETDPYNIDTNLRQNFAVKDLLVQPTAEGVRVLASYNHWYADRDCYVLRVSSIEASASALQSGAYQGEWRTVYETAPCRGLTENPNGVNRNPTLAAGGRMVTMPDEQVLVTVGGFGPETLTVDDPDGVRTQAYDNSYGKTILFDLTTDSSRIYTIGHRNPQGLALSNDGEIWLTEHAARGGDELNRIVDGRNYGYPIVSYGTEYGSLVWSTNPQQGRHDGFEKPIYAWVPSIGISQAVVIDGPMYEHWRGDVLVSSLAQETLYRVRIEDGRTIFAEPITIGHRIRDVTQARDGTIVLKTDDDFLVYLSVIDASTMDADLEPEVRGEVMAAACAGCHALDRDGGDGIGPTLWDIVGRDVATRDGYPYSEALERMDGAWTPERLRRFIVDPNEVAPGTSMVATTDYSQVDAEAIVAYLRTLR